MIDGWSLLAEWILSHLVDLQISFLSGCATFFWWVAKLINTITLFLVNENLWDLLLDSLLTNLQTHLPTLLGEWIFAPTGLFYLALCLAGILLILGLGETSFAQAPQVIIWGCFVSALFISTTFGYDLILNIEEARRWTAMEAVTVIAPSGELSDLITIPMRSNAAEAADLTFNLPAQFGTDFFPAAANYQTHTGLFLDTWMTGQITIDFQIEEQTAQETRLSQAWEGVMLATLTLAPAGLEALFGLITATISSAVVLLIIFFLATLPLGFFTFGRDILQQIIQQYTYLWILSLASALLMGLLMSAGTLFLPGTPTLPVMVSYLPLLVVVSIALTYLLVSTTNAMKGTLGMVTATVQASLKPNSLHNQLPTAGDVPLSASFQQAYDKASSIAGLAAVGATAAFTGGSSMVIPALAGGVLNRIDQQTAHDVGFLTRLNNDSPAAQTFATAAMTKHAIPAMAMLAALGRKNTPTPSPSPSTDSGQATPEEITPEMPLTHQPAVANLLDKELADPHRTTGGGLTTPYPPPASPIAEEDPELTQSPYYEFSKQVLSKGRKQRRLEGLSAEAKRQRLNINQMMRLIELAQDTAITWEIGLEQSGPHILPKLAQDPLFSHLPQEAHYRLARSAVNLFYSPPPTRTPSVAFYPELNYYGNVEAMYQVNEMAQKYGVNMPEVYAHIQERLKEDRQDPDFDWKRWSVLKNEDPPLPEIEKIPENDRIDFGLAVQRVVKTGHTGDDRW